MTDERVWHVTYWLESPHMRARPVGCVCNEPGERWYPHYHDNGEVKRAPDRIVRKPCDPLYSA